MENIATDYFKQAMKSVVGLSWLSSLAQITPVTTDFIGDEQANPLIDRLEATLERLGMTHDGKFEEEEKFIKQNLAKPEKEHFEAAHERLGNLLGFDAGNRESSGAPDPWWIVDRRLCFVFEDHSNANPDASIGADKARQAATHPTWIRANLEIDADAEIIPILVTPAKRVDRDALPLLKGVFIWNIDEFRKWADDAIAVIREIRNTFSGSGDIAWRANALSLFSKQNLTPKALRKYLSDRTPEKLFNPKSQKG